jgi:hypothetical protein
MWITKKYIADDMLEMPNSLTYEEKFFTFSFIFSLLSTRVIMSLDIDTRGW